MTSKIISSLTFSGLINCTVYFLNSKWKVKNIILNSLLSNSNYLSASTDIVEYAKYTI